MCTPHCTLASMRHALTSQMTPHILPVPQCWHIAPLVLIGNLTSSLIGYESLNTGISRQNMEYKNLTTINL